MSALRHRLSSDVGAFPPSPRASPRRSSSSSGTVTGAGAGQVLLTAATVGVLTVVLATTAVRTVRPLPVRVHASGVPARCPPSTAYWCALDAPRCPQRPRAPGRH